MDNLNPTTATAESSSRGLKKQGTMAKTEASNTSSTTSRSSANNSFIVRFLPTDKITRLLANISPEDSLFCSVCTYIYFAISFYFILISGLSADVDSTGIVSEIVHEIFVEIPFKLGAEFLIKDETILFASFQVMLGFLIVVQLVLLLLTLWGMNSLKTMKNGLFKKLFKIVLLFTYCCSPTFFNICGEFLHCNVFQVYSSTVPNFYNTHFPSQSCFGTGLLMFELLSIIIAIFQTIVVIFAAYAFIPISQIKIFGLYGQTEFFSVMLLVAIPFMVHIFAPNHLIFLGYLSSFLVCAISLLILFFKHPFHAWWQGATLGGFISFRGIWSLIIAFYEILSLIIRADFFPSKEFQTSFENLLNIIGAFVYLASFIISLILGALVFGLFTLYYLRIISKFKKMMKNKKKEMEEDGDENANNANNGNNPLTIPRHSIGPIEDKHSSSGGSQNNLKQLIIKKRGNMFVECFYQCFGSSMSNSEFIIGLQLTSNERNLDHIIFEEMVHERVFEDLKRDNTELVFSLIVFLLTRRKMEKMKYVISHPNLSELLMLLLRRYEQKATGLSSKLQLMTVTNYLFNLHDKSATDYEIKSTQLRTQKLEAQFWALNEAFWKQILDGKQTNYLGKAKKNLLILIKKIKMKKQQIRDLYEYLLASFPKDPSTLKLYGKYLHVIERNPDSQFFLEKARDIEEQKIRRKRKKLFQNRVGAFPDFLEDPRNKSMVLTDTHESSLSEGDEQSVISSTPDEEKEKQKQEKLSITNSILRKKTEWAAKGLNFLIFAIIVLAPISFVALCFYIILSNASVVQQNSLKTYHACRLPGDLLYSLISMRSLERNLTQEEYASVFESFTRTEEDIKEAFAITKDAGNQKELWEVSLPMTFITLYPISNFSDWNNNFIYRRVGSVSLASMANVFLNYLHEFEKANHTLAYQQAQKLVPYTEDTWNAMLDLRFVAILENAFTAGAYFDNICEKVYTLDKDQSVRFEYILIGCFVALLFIPFPGVLLFIVLWYFLMRKQKNLMTLFWLMPKDVLGSIYQEIKKKNHEQSKQYASNYGLRLCCFFTLALIIFFFAAIFAFVVTLLCVLASISTLSSIRDAAGTTYNFLAVRFLAGEFAKKYYSDYPITTPYSDADVVRLWIPRRVDFYYHWDSLRFGNGYEGLESKGLDCTPLAEAVAHLLVSYNRMTEYAAITNKNGATNSTNAAYIREKVYEAFLSVEDVHLTILTEIIKFLPYLMSSNSSLSIALLIIVIFLATPINGLLAFLLLRVVFEYENDNYELLQQFQRAPPEIIVQIPAIRNYIFDSSLAEVDNFALTRMMSKCCSCRSIFRKRIGASGVPGESASVLAEDIYQSSPTPILACAQNGNVAFINGPAVSCFEFENPTEVLGVNVTRLFSVSSKLVITGFFKNLQRNADAMAKRREVVVKEEHVVGKRKSGKEFPASLSISTNVVKGQMMILLYVNDVTTLVQHEALIQEEKQKSEKLLLNILPAAVAKRLSDGEQLICESFPDVTCFFSDICGFTNMSSKITAWALIKLLNDIVNGFDEVADLLNIEKIKTIGDAYFAVSGLHFNNNDHPQKMMLFAIRAREVLARINQEYLPQQLAEGEHKTTIEIRIGMHTGPVVGGVIGKSKFQYDVWGSTVNLASRMESTGIAGKIQVSRATYERLHDIYKFEERDNVYVKGVGEVKTYVLDDSKLPEDVLGYLDEQMQAQQEGGFGRNSSNHSGGSRQNANLRESQKETIVVENPLSAVAVAATEDDTQGKDSSASKSNASRRSSANGKSILLERKRSLSRDDHID